MLDFDSIETRPMGEWITKQGDDNQADLFWARSFTGVDAHALESIGAVASAGLLDCLPTPEDEPAETYGSLIKGMKDDNKTLVMVQDMFADVLKASADRLQALMGTRPEPVTMAKLVLLSFHPDIKMQWNSVVPRNLRVNARTMFAATSELEELNRRVGDAVLNKNTDERVKAVQRILIHA